MGDLKVAVDILQEFIKLEDEKQQRAVQSKKEEKAVADAVVNKVRLS
jgi:hypothetical protein